MSMQIFTVLQFAYILLLYLAVMILIPAAVFHPFFEERPFQMRFMAYLTIGNFYVMNLVFLLQLLHISNRITLIIGVVVPAIIAIAVINWKKWVKQALESAGETTHNVLVNTMGFRLFFSKILRWTGQKSAQAAVGILKSLFTKWYDWIGVFIVMVLVFWQYGTNMVTNLGYFASDMPVHNSWINHMCDNEIFKAGVYPHGFHCVLYFFHEVFGVQVYTLLRLFALLQTTIIHLLLLAFLRGVCKIKASAYGAVGFFLLLNIWNENTYLRYLYSLPQEYGMVFILPSIYFLIAFFTERKQEEGEKGWKLFSTVMLGLFAMNFSMTLAVHFYDTMIAGIFCVAVAIGFISLVFRKAYFWRILIAGILSIFVAVLPMGIAYAGGTPLEGSLRWGLSIMKVEEEEPKEMYADLLEAAAQNPSDIIGGAAAELIGKTETMDSQEVVERDSIGGDMGNYDKPYQDEYSEAVVSKAPSLWERVKGIGFAIVNKLRIMVISARGAYRLWVIPVLEMHMPGISMLFLLMALVCCLLSFFLKDGERAFILVSGTVNTVLLSIVMISADLGIPALMDKSRCSIYLAYMLTVLLGLVLDFLFALVSAWAEEESVKQVIPTAVVALFFLVAALAGWVKTPRLVDSLETNGAITCVANILRDNDKGNFTIISANDELHMVEEYGYFYEIITLLRSCVGSNVDRYITIPTPKIYVFLEKIPVDYTVHYDGSGQSVSEEGAKKALPLGSGLGIYQGENRHIVMSKLYYWVQAFRQMYENETSVYYEDDQFICYEIEQNPYRLFDLSIDYGYNNAGLNLN